MGKRRAKKKSGKFSPAPSESQAVSTRRREAQIEATVADHAEPLCLSEALELVAVEYKREPVGRVLRVFIDGPSGVGLDDCARVSRQLGDILDVYLADLGPYSLEVSSPGAERPLMKPSDYDRFKGQQAKIRLIQPMVGSQRNYAGVLDGLIEDRVRLRVDGDFVEIALENIAKARLVVDFAF